MNNGLFPNPKLVKVDSFTSAEIAIQQATATIAVNHYLTGLPRRVRWVFVCKIAEAGYSIGDELDLMSVREASNVGIHATIGANKTQAFIVISPNQTWQLFNYTTSATASLTSANWRFKCYADLN